LTAKYDKVTAIMQYENGEMNDDEVIKLFSHLIKDGSAFSLQGSYGRMASSLIENGLIDENGKINKKQCREMGLTI